MSLLQNVLRPKSPSQVEELNAKLKELHTSNDSSDPSLNAQQPANHNGSVTSATDTSASEDENDFDLIPVASAPGTPQRFVSRNQSRSASPTRSAPGARRSAVNVPGLTSLSTSSSPLSSGKTTNKKSKTDPVRVLTTDLVQRIFSTLRVQDLANASRVCTKWNKSQSLNYIWFLQNRKLEFNDDVLPTGKWTRKESKENWRKAYMRTSRTLREADYTSSSRYGYSAPSSNIGSGYATPREQREERWAEENSMTGSNATKLEKRDMYKELGGRKAKSKTKVGMSGAGRDKGGWEAPED